MKIRESGMPSEGIWERFFEPEKILEKLDLNRTTGNVVDFGCGYGTFTIAAARIIRGKVYAIDINPIMIGETRRRAIENGLTNAVTIMRDFMILGSGLRDRSVDYVMLFNILHAERPMNMLREAHRILKGNGKVAITHWNRDASTPRGPPMEMRPTPYQCILWAKAAGFNNPEIYDLKPYHYGIVLNKIREI